jgi:adenosine deaminase
MTVATYIEAMPKVDLHVHLEGAISKNMLLVIADQNDVSESVKHFNTWVNLLEKPEYDRLEELIRVVSGWVRQPEDLTRLAYEAGTHLARQNVRYAEITVSPALYNEITLTPEQFFAAINDGRDRALRAWGIDISWILAFPREEPRKADDLVRFATSPAGRRAGVVAVGLVGKESVQPVGQFERAFAAAEKKGIARVPHAGDIYGAEGIDKAATQLLPNRIADAWGAAASQPLIDTLVEQKIALDLSLPRAVAMKKIASLKEYPLRKLYDDGVLVTLGSDMPVLFKTTLTDQYRQMIDVLSFAMDELEDIALNAVRVSLLPDDSRAELLIEFQNEYERLRIEHIAPQTT